MALIKNVKIANYKSIANASLEVRRVNVFVGEPNTGKSNLLEALALMTSGIGPHFATVSRARETADLFFDHDLERQIKVTLNDQAGWDLKFEVLNGNFTFQISDLIGSRPASGSLSTSVSQRVNWPVPASSPIKFYHFKHQRGSGAIPQYGHLLPPYGQNLPALLYSNKALRESISAVFRERGFRLEIRPQEGEILVSKEVQDVLYSYRFDAISETLQRIVFYKAVLETNRDAVLVLDEPESNTFPFYTKYLAERIALDETNQFFLTTHNPYVLTSLIEKTPRDQIAVFVTRMKDYQTEFQRASDEQMSEMLGLTMDVFVDLDRFFPG
jgi:predicted ATPase